MFAAKMLAAKIFKVKMLMAKIPDTKLTYDSV